MTRSCSFPDWLIICIALPLTPIWLPIVCATKGYKCIKYKIDTRENREIRRRNATRPPQLPYSRRFNPSIATLPSDTVECTSPFLRLPYPIRRQIYGYLFDNRYIIHIQTRPKKIIHWHALYPSDWAPKQHIRKSAGFTQPPLEDESPGHMDLEILRTCRTIYQEAHSLVYSTNTFAFHHLDHLIYLNQALRPQHLAMIKYLQIDWDMPFVPQTVTGVFRRPFDGETWVRFWNIVATRLVGLKSLDLAVRVWLWDLAHEHKWLKDVARCRGLKEFILQITYPVAGDPGEDGDREGVKAVRREVERLVKKPRHTRRWRVRSFDKSERQVVQEMQGISTGVRKVQAWEKEGMEWVFEDYD
jgi:hypothetical protein